MSQRKIKNAPKPAGPVKLTEAEVAKLAGRIGQIEFHERKAAELRETVGDLVQTIGGRAGIVAPYQLNTEIWELRAAPEKAQQPAA